MSFLSYLRHKYSFYIKNKKKYPKWREYHNISLLIDKIYQDTKPHKISLLEKQRLGLMIDDYVYGEIDIFSFLWLLDFIKPQPKEIFYDLGSGVGKTLIAASLAFDFSRCVGFELLSSLNEIAKNKIIVTEKLVLTKQNFLAKIKNLSTINLHNSDYLQADFSDGDVVFINATTLNFYTWEKILSKLIRLKIGARVLVSTKKINLQEFKLIYENRLQMSWGKNSFFIYEKIN